MSSQDTQSTRGETKPFVKDINVLNKTEEMRGEIIQHISYAINAYIDGDPAYVAKPYAEKIMQVIAQHDTAYREGLLEAVKTNQRGQFEDDGGNICWYLDDLSSLIATYGTKTSKEED